MKILITGGKSATALKVRRAFENEQVILADYGDVPSFSSSTYQLISLGEKNEETIAHNLLNHCLDDAIDIIIPLNRFEIEPLAKAKILFDEFNVNVLLPDASKLTGYLNSGLAQKDWLVCNAGVLIYSTIQHELIDSNISDERLSGAFYVEVSFDQPLLKLVTI